MKTTTITFIAKIVAIAAGFGLVFMTFAPAFRADAASYPIEGQQYYLSGAGVTSSATTVPLTSLKTPDGRVMTMAMIGAIGYGTLEPQTSSKVESITFTGVTQNGNGSASLTGVTRGIDFAYPYAASATYRQSHAGGSTFIITNTPNFYYDQFTMNNNNNLFTWPAASSSPASKGYVDFVAFNGAAVINADTGNKGVVQISTGAQASATTALGGTGASLALTSAIATSTWNPATAANVVVVTKGTGKIDDNFISTSTLFTNLSFSTTTSIGAFPAWQIGKQSFISTTTGTSTFPVPSGITSIWVELIGAGGASQTTAGSGAFGGGGSGARAMKNINVTGTSTIQFFLAPGALANSTAAASYFGTNGFYLTANSGGLSNNRAGGIGGSAVGGDININGQPGGSAATGDAGGQGGGTLYGGGGVGTSCTGNGVDGNGMGAGAGGGCNTGSGITGGAGANAGLIIRW